MDNHAAKGLLAAYRPDGSDARDPVFREALEQCEAEPSLRTWFETEKDFDRRCADALQSLPVPAGGKRETLAWMEMEPTDKRSGGRGNPILTWLTGLGLAASLVLAFWLFGPNDGEGTLIERDGFQISQLAEQALPLQHQGRDPQALLAWLKARGAPRPGTIPESLRGAEGIGCRVYQTEGGGSIGLVCLELNGRIVHVLAFDEKARELLEKPTPSHWREGDWNLMTLENGFDSVFLATRSDPHEIGLL